MSAPSRRRPVDRRTQYTAMLLAGIAIGFLMAVLTWCLP